MARWGIVVKVPFNSIVETFPDIIINRSEEIHINNNWIFLHVKIDLSKAQLIFQNLLENLSQFIALFCEQKDWHTFHCCQPGNFNFI